MTRPVLKTEICERLGIEYPILLAGMGSRGKATPPALVAAVSEAGGLGVVGGSGLPPEVLRHQIREARKLTDRPIGVDLILPGKVAADAGLTRSEVRQKLRAQFPDQVSFVEGLMAKHGLEPAPIEDEFVVANTSGEDGGTPGNTNRNMIQQQVDVIMEEDVQLFAAGLGDPGWVVPLAKARDMQVIGLAGSPRNAVRQMEAGVDIIVAQGHEAGGHTGKIANFPLIPQVVDAVAPAPVASSTAAGSPPPSPLVPSGAGSGPPFLPPRSARSTMTTSARSSRAARRISRSVTSIPARPCEASRTPLSRLGTMPGSIPCRCLIRRF